jgi:uncharacterized membrane protein
LIFRKVPVDTTIVIVFVLIADPIVLLVNYPPVRAVFGLPLLLFLPGYAVLTVLFPTRSPPYSNQLLLKSDSDFRSIDSVERMALSVGMSFALLPLIALVFWAIDDQGFGTTVLLGMLTAITVLGMVYGTHRRLQLPKWQRYQVPISHWIDEIEENIFDDEVTETTWNIILIISIVLAVGSLGYVVVVPNQSASYTRVSLLTQDASGDLSVANYSTEIEAGTGIDPILAIENRERTPVSYTIIIEIQHIIDDKTVSSTELARYRAVVPAGETAYVNHTVSPTVVGETLKLQYLVYKGEPPSDPTATNAYRTLFLWIDVSNGPNTNSTSETEIERKRGRMKRAAVIRKVIS